jgi:hypothetical protein
MIERFYFQGGCCQTDRKAFSIRVGRADVNRGTLLD